MVKRVGLLLLLLLVLSGCDWRTAMGLRQPPKALPPRQPPPSFFPPNDPLGQLVEERGGVLQRIQGPMFQEGQSAIFFRHSGRKECAVGLVVYNSNGGVQGSSQSSGTCSANGAEGGGTQQINTQNISWGTVPAGVVRVEVTVDGTLHKVEVTEGIWWLVWTPASRQGNPPRLQVAGFDANGNQVHGANRP